MNKLPWIILISALGAIVLATALFGWPDTLNEAGGFAEFVGALLMPISLLLVLALNAEASTRRQATADNFLALQVQSLVALIEDDRHMLDSIRASGKFKTTFKPIHRRYRERVSKLNAFLKEQLELPAFASESDPAE